MNLMTRYSTTATSQDTGSSWDIFTDLVHEPWLRSADFPVGYMGFACGDDGSFYESIDAGGTWNALPVPASVDTVTFNDLDFLSNDIGYMVGGIRILDSLLLHSDSVQVILKTNDGGENWNIQHNVDGYWLKSVAFIDESTGIACGEKGTILRTTNGGTNWTEIAPPAGLEQRDFNEVLFLDDDTGFLVGGAYTLDTAYTVIDSVQTILKTVNAGQSWSVVVDEAGSMLNAIGVRNVSSIYCVGMYGTILESSDQGDNSGSSFSATKFL